MSNYIERQNELNKYRKERKRKKLKTRFIIFLCLVLAGGIVGTLFFAPMFEVTHIYVIGNERTTEDEIISASNVTIRSNARGGDNVFRTSIQGVISNVSELPYVRYTNARRIYPNRLRIWVRESEPQANIAIEGGRYAVIDERGRILDVLQEPYNLPTFRGLIVDNPIRGEQLAAENAANMEIGLVILNEIINNEVTDSIISIDITSLTQITMNFENRVNVIIGDANNLEYKIMFFSHIVRQQILPHDQGVLDMSLEDPYFRPTN